MSLADRARAALRRRWIPIGLVLAALALATGAVLEVDARLLAENRARWEEKTDLERSLLRQRFEELSGFEPAQRSALIERSRRLRRLEARLADETPPGLREELERLSPPERRMRWRLHVRDQVRERGRELVRKLPSWLVQRVREAVPAERSFLIETFLHDLRAREGRRAAKSLARALELPAEEVERFDEMPQPEVLRRLLPLRRAQIERALEVRGVPVGLREELAPLDDATFLERARTLSSEFPGS